MERVVEVIKEGQIIQMPLSQAEEEELFVLRSVEDDKYLEIEPKSVVSRDEAEIRKNRVAEELIPNFHWKVVRIRREKGFSRKQLAEMIGEPEEDLKKFEYGEIVNDNFVLASKVEQALGTSLRKEKGQFNSARQMVERVPEGREKKENKEDNFLGTDIELLD